MTEKPGNEQLRKLTGLVERLQAASQEEREQKRDWVRRHSPVATLEDVLARDPARDERSVRETVTFHLLHRIRYREMTYGDWLAVCEAEGEKRNSPSTWSVETKARFLAHNLVEPDVVGAARDAGHEFGPEWLKRHMKWAVVDDIVNTIVAESDPPRRIPQLEFVDEEGGEAGFTPRDGSATPSRSSGSTTSAIDGPVPAASTSSPSAS